MFMFVSRFAWPYNGANPLFRTVSYGTKYKAAHIPHGTNFQNTAAWELPHGSSHVGIGSHTVLVDYNISDYAFPHSHG